MRTKRGRSRYVMSDFANRQIIIGHYGGKCACCGESEPKFLTIDHVNNDGHKEQHMKAGELYRKIIRSGFSKRYQLLCFNCNCGRERNGGVCPHLGVETQYHLRPDRTNGAQVFTPLPLFDPTEV
jgi:hypothetical protein